MNLTIVKPSVQIWEQKDYHEHIAKCARVCYKSDKGDNKVLVRNLINNNHLSMFRHYSRYWIIPSNEFKDIHIFSSEYCDLEYHDGYFYVVSNEHYYIEHNDVLVGLNRYLVDEDYFINHSFKGKEMRRITIKCVTQISTSRELNRVSPNNIAEQSTRYVNFNKKGGSICCPWWLLDQMDKDIIELTEQEVNDILSLGNDPTEIYITSCYNSFNNYNTLVDKQLLTPQDARGVLPLDTTTEVVYTYSIKEWKAILDLRYYGTTGKPHPNAKLIAGIIRDEINKLGYNL